MVRPILHVACVDAIVWAGILDHASELGSTNREFTTSQDQSKYAEMISQD